MSWTSWINPLSYWSSAIPDAPPYPTGADLTSAIRKQRAQLRKVETRETQTGRSPADIENEAAIQEAKKKLKPTPALAPQPNL